MGLNPLLMEYGFVALGATGPKGLQAFIDVGLQPVQFCLKLHKIPYWPLRFSSSKKDCGRQRNLFTD
jgi:hypothetical protein